MVENAPDIILLADLDGTIRFINRRTEIASGSLGRSVYDYLEEPYKVTMRAGLEAVRTTGQPQRFEVKGLSENGEPGIWYANRLGPILSDDRIESVILIATDITARKIAEEQLHREQQWLRRLLDLQERERRLVAYDIHDGLVQYLTGALMHLDVMAATAPVDDRAQAEYDRGLELMREALAEGRRLISGLRPPILDERGVVAALEYAVNEVRPYVPQIEFINRTNFERLAPAIEVAIFRIAQEALTNVRLHSGAQRAQVQLIQQGEWVRLVIRDWGRGFNPATVHEERFGLQGVRQRAALLGASAVIESAPGQGTVVTVDFPLIPEKALPAGQRGRRATIAMPNTLSPRLQILLGAAAIIVVTAIAYSPALTGDFLLDDNTLLTDSSLIKASDGLYQFWCTTGAADYWPLTNSSFWLEWRLWGANPTGYHVTNVLSHLAAVFLLWAILRKLSIPGAFLAALLFAVHPVNVESVAWIAQRKNTLSMLFFLLSILWYLPTAEQRATANGPRTKLCYLLSFLAFVLAMLSKGSVAILPIVLLLLVWWQRRRIGLPDVLRTVPFFLAAILLGTVNVWFQTHGFAESIRSATIAQRLAGAGAAIWFYLAKTFLPIDLLFVYPQWNIQTALAAWWLPLWALVAVSAVLWWRRNTRWGRPLLFAWAFFCVALLPVLGFADVGFMQFSLVADHYQHIALIGALALASAAVSTWIGSRTARIRTAAVVLPAAAIGLLAALTWQRNMLFRSAIDLYITTLESNPDCWQLHNSLAVVLNGAGKYQQASDQCRAALRQNPHSADAHFNLAIALGKTDQTAQSIQQFQQTLNLRPDRAAEVESAWGSVLISAGRLDEAIEHCQKSVKLNPNSADALKNLGIAHLENKQPSLAVENLRDALRLAPTTPISWPIWQPHCSQPATRVKRLRATRRRCN